MAAINAKALFTINNGESVMLAYGEEYRISLGLFDHQETSFLCLGTILENGVIFSSKAPPLILGTSAVMEF